MTTINKTPPPTVVEVITQAAGRWVFNPQWLKWFNDLNNTTAKVVSPPKNFAIYFGSGAPGFAATQGSLYIRSDGSSSSTRMYINTNGSTGWTNFVTAA